MRFKAPTLVFQIAKSSEWLSKVGVSCVSALSEINSRVKYQWRPWLHRWRLLLHPHPAKHPRPPLQRPLIITGICLWDPVLPQVNRRVVWEPECKRRREDKLQRGRLSLEAVERHNQLVIIQFFQQVSETRRGGGHLETYKNSDLSWKI